MSLLSRLFGGADEAPKPLPYLPGSPEGLAARWVQWAAAHRLGADPISDLTGEFAASQQPADVFFLAGTFGGSVRRRCVIPAGTPIFFPVFNMWFWPDHGPEAVPQAFGSLRVDGERDKPDVIATPKPFEVRGARSNPVTGRTRPTATTVWGLWKYLEPLTPGAHEISFQGGDGHGFEVGATYQIQVS